MITDQEYYTAENKYLGMTDKEVGRMAKQSADEQPAVFFYVATYYDLLEEDENKDFFIQLIYCIWIAYNNKYELKRKLTVKDLEELEKADEKLINELSENESAILDETIKRMTKHTQAQLISCLYTQIGDYFELDQVQDDDMNNSSHHDAGVISGVINSFINLLEKSRQVLYVS